MKEPARRESWVRADHLIFVFAIIFSVIFLLHSPLLRLPYFWDEAGYFIPAAYDLYKTSDLIPHSTLSNAHPPLVMVWLAMWWKLSGYAPAVTRTAMLLVAAFGLLGVWRLASRVANRKVAVASVVCTALYPVFFAQSSLAMLDVAAGAMTIWGMAMHVEKRRVSTIVLLAIAGLVKETTIVAPLTLFAWELVCPYVSRWRVITSRFQEDTCVDRRHLGHTFSFLLCIVPLVAWYAYHYHRTGYVFGNPEFLQYNLGATLNPLRIVLAALTRLWHVLGYMNLFFLTIPAAIAMRMTPVRDAGVPRERIAIRIQILFYLLIVAHVIEFAVLGGAALARYMVPVIPLVIIVCVSTLYRRVPEWPVWVAVACAGFVFALFVNPPWHFAPEDNLAYSDFVKLHKSAANYVSSHEREKRVLTAWPASDEISKPFLGYVKQPVAVVRIENFSAEQVLGAAQHRDAYEAALVFSTKYEPRFNLFRHLPWWERLQERFFDYHRDLPPDVVAQLLGGKIVFEQQRGGQWVAVIGVEHVENAKLVAGH